MNGGTRPYGAASAAAAAAPQDQRWKWMFGCGVGCVVMGGLTFIAIIGLLLYFGRDPENFLVDIDYPWQVAVGEPFDVVMEMRNTGDTEIEVGDIDLDEALSDSFLDGCRVLSSQPSMELDSAVPGIKSFHYNRLIGPGEVQTVTFTVEAIEAGKWGGTVGIYADGLLLQHRVDIVAVHPEDLPPAGAVEKPET